MTTNEYDLIIDEIADEAFDLLNTLSTDKTMSDIELRNEICESFDISEMMATRVYGAWELQRKEKNNTRLVNGLQEPHPAHKARIKALETVVKEIL